MPITIQIIADTEAELKRMVASLAPIAFGQGRPILSTDFGTAGTVMTTADGKVAAVVDLAEDMGEATELDPNAEVSDDEPAEEAPAAEPKRGRGRPAGAKNKAKVEAEAEPVATADMPVTGSAGSVATLDTEKAEKTRAEAIRILTTVFGRSDDGKKAIRALQQRYAVTKFSDVELDFADKLLADAKQLDADVK